MVLLDRVKEGEAREWYLRGALQNGWSRNVLVHMISGQLHEREGKALTNFHRELPTPESDLAEQTLKDPYNFDFLTVTAAAKEREIERGLLTHLRDLLLRGEPSPVSSGRPRPSTSICSSTMSDCTDRYFVFDR
ncbi:uncharacterized protein DUF1016 [Edaphobacter modestus]|uniref:Uncharacterized protein DUF1016 n=1 Tax=Edaphobacter modestus TaxID=388466 RepID=A0A4V2G1M0_9BACT|nr:uncharacterized protein DUF1016 [Edaphobacter modestus]